MFYLNIFESQSTYFLFFFSKKPAFFSSKVITDFRFGISAKIYPSGLNLRKFKILIFNIFTFELIQRWAWSWFSAQVAPNYVYTRVHTCSSTCPWLCLLTASHRDFGPRAYSAWVRTGGVVPCISPSLGLTPPARSDPAGSGPVECVMPRKCF